MSDDYYSTDYDDREPYEREQEIKYVTKTVESNYAQLVQRINKKIVDLQDQLIGNAYGGNKLNENDILRYSAMVEILKAVLMKP